MFSFLFSLHQPTIKIEKKSKTQYQHENRDNSIGFCEAGPNAVSNSLGSSRTTFNLVSRKWKHDQSQKNNENNKKLKTAETTVQGEEWFER